MGIRPSFTLLTLLLLGLSACEASAPLAVDDEARVSPEFSTGEKPGQPTLDVDWLLKDTYDNSPINLSGVLASQNSRGMSEVGLLPVTILGTESMDFGLLLPASVTLADPRGPGTTLWEMDGKGVPLTETTYRDKDQILDLMVHFNLRSMYENGDIRVDTEELCLTVTLQDGSTFESCRPVNVI